MNVKYKELAPQEFVDKIKNKMAAENLGVTQLARKIHVSHPTIVEIVTYGYKPSFDTCLALSAWLMQSPILTLREAGLLPFENDNDLKWEDWQFLLSKMSAEDETELRQIAEMKIDRRQKAEQSTRAAKFYPKKTK